MTESEFIALLRCPDCGGALHAESDALVCEHNAALRYPVLREIPRFVDEGHYADSFGYQWNRFRRVQLDSYNGSRFSEERFRTITGWTPEQLRGQLVLDAGCGAGRFSEVVAGYGAKLVAFDLSSAIDAASETLANTGARLAQASIFDPPFDAGVFDYVYCIGVIQHTPDPVRAIRSLCRLVRAGGRIGLWIYEKNWKAWVGTTGYKYAFRFLTRRLSRRAQVRLSEWLTASCWPLIRVCRKLGFPGRVVTRLLPVASAHLHDVRLSDEDLRAWIVLDTLDMYSPAYDQPQRWDDVVAILSEEGFTDIRRHPHGAISVTAFKPA